MRTDDARVVARIKTRELTHQYRRITEDAAALRRALETTDAATARFELLRDGLDTMHRAIGQRFALEGFVAGTSEEIRAYGPDAARHPVVVAAAARLERELVALERRAAAAVLYGRLYEEAASSRADARSALAPPAPALDPRAEERLAHLRALWETPRAVDVEGLRAIVAETLTRPPTADELAIFQAAVTKEEVRAHLAAIAANPDHHHELRAAARRLLGDDDGHTDLAGALSILLRDLDAWRWEEWSAVVNLRWNRTRWLTFLDVDLVPRLFLDVVTLRLTIFARTSWGARRSASAPASLHDRTRQRLVDDLVFVGLGESLEAFRALGDHGYVGGGAPSGGPDPFQRLFAIVGADLWWAANTGTPTTILQTDVADFFPSLPHPAIATVLEVIGVPRSVVSFVDGFLRGPYPLAADVADACGTPAVTPGAGIFAGTSLSRFLGDALLVALDHHVKRASGARVARFMDDVYAVGTEDDVRSAWTAMSQFFSASGLRPNPDKTRMSRFAEREPIAELAAEASSTHFAPGVARAPVRWGFLVLDGDVFVPALDAVADLGASLRERLRATTSVRDAAREYNAAAGYLVRGLAPLLPLTIDHVDRLHEALRLFHDRAFPASEDTRSSVAAHFRKHLTKHSADLARDFATALPDAWFHWPLSEGGLGLEHPPSVLASARAALATFKPPAPPPSTLPEEDATWCAAFETRASAPLRFAPPAVSPEMEGRQRDLVASLTRSNAILRPYWRWLLETHGRSLVDFFGTLRFLARDVLPIDDRIPAPSLVTPDDDDIPF